MIKEGEKVKSLVQVSSDLPDPKTKQIKEKALLSASVALNSSDLQIITLEEEGTEKVSGKTIRITPLWKWLLNLSPLTAEG